MATSTLGGPREITKKIIVVGDVGVGKTSFVARVTEGRFISEHKTTIGGLCMCVLFCVNLLCIYCIWFRPLE